MSLKLSGSLKYFPLVNVFDFLISGEMSGLISIEKDGKKGEVYLDKGEVVYASYKNLFKGKEAFFKLFTVSEGTFYFKHIDVIPERTLTQDTGELMAEVSEKIISWEELKKIITSEQVSFKLIPASTEFKDAEIYLSRDEWLILTRLDGVKNIGEICEELGMELIEAGEIISNFFKAGYIQPVDVFETREIMKEEKPIEVSILSGDLKSFSLLSIIDFLFRNHMSGRLKLSRGIYQGEVYMEEGELLHADNSIWDGEMALVDLLSWAKGKFSFIPIPSPFKETLTTPVEEIILSFGENLNKWRKIQSVISTPELIFTVNLTDQEKDDEEQLTFSRKHWKVMYNINGTVTLRRMAEKMKLHVAEVADIVYSLYKEGLVEPLQSESYIAAEKISQKEKLHFGTLSDIKETERGLQDIKVEKKKEKRKSKKLKEEIEVTHENPIGIIKSHVDDLMNVMGSDGENMVKEEPENFLDR